MPESRYCLAVDIGGTKLEAGLVDSGGMIRASARVPTASGSEDPEALMGSLATILDEVASPAAPVVVGVGCGGPMTPRGAEVSPLNIPVWRDFPLRSRLEELYDVPVHIDNDAKALALGEWWCGGAAGRDCFLAVIVGTGVGGGLVVDGRLLDGDTGNAGHIGHLIVEPDGHLCGCGARGCLEAEASGTAIRSITGADPSAAGPEVVERAGTMVGRAVASVANLLDLRLALVAGSVALGFGEPFFRAAQKEIDTRARLEFTSGALIRAGALGDRGPLVGAAAVGWRGIGAPGPWNRTGRTPE